MHRHERAAEEAVLDDLRRALSCLTTTVLLPRSRTKQPMSRTLELARNPTPLPGPSRLMLQLFHTYMVRPSQNEEGWEAATTEYRYELYDRDAAEILAYHWHPDGRSSVKTPHLHVAAQRPPIDLAKRHLPTGHVRLHSLIHCLITEFGVEPLRPDWDQILRDP